MSLKKNKRKMIITSVMSSALVVSATPVQLFAEEQKSTDVQVNSEEIKSVEETQEVKEPQESIVPISQEVEDDKQVESKLKVSKSTLSMTAEDTIEIEATFDHEVNKDDLKITLGDKSLDEWKTYVIDDKDYTGEPFIKIDDTIGECGFKIENKDGKSTVKATLKAGLLYGKEDLSDRKIRVKFPEKLGKYVLKLSDKKSSFETTMKLNVYDSYRTYNELKPEIDRIFKENKNKIHLSYESIGKSIEGRDLHFVTVAKDKKSVDEYLKMVPTMLENPKSLQEKIKNNQMGDYKVPIFINNIHPDESPGIDAQLDFLEKLTTQKQITYKTTDESNKEIEKTLDVEELLDHVIFLMDITENPDGRYYNTRPNALGFDVNRDNAYQTQRESQSLTAQIAKWNPISFLDLHGFVEKFLIEPCSPPHDPNYEYDLIAKNVSAEAHAMGKAAIANSKYKSYQIPYEDQDEFKYGGWDDAAPAYTATYALHHGALSHTIEMPQLNQESNDAVVHAILGASSFVLENKDKLFNDQLEYFRRGVEGIDDRNIDKFLVNGELKQVGRPRGQNENFFPEYYVLPINEELQKNKAQVYDTVEYLIRNGVKVSQLKSNTNVDGKTYAKGSYVIDMHQAKRGYANAILYQGSDESTFSQMYSEIVLNFPDVRGFNEYEIRKANEFKDQLTDVKSVKRDGTEVGSYREYVIKNTNNDAIKAVNKLLKDNKKVQVLTKANKDYEEGDFLVSANDLKSVSRDYSLKIVPLKEAVNAKKLETPKVYVKGTYSDFILKQLGFNIVNNINESDIVVDESWEDINPKDIKDGIDYLGIGYGALQNVGTNLIEGLKLGIQESNKWCMYEGLLKAEYDKEDINTSGYDDEQYIYTAEGSWIESVPKGVKTIATVSNKDDYYVSGWWPENKVVKGKAMGVTKEIGDTNVTLYANTITNKAHTQASYRLLSNPIYNSIESKEEIIKPSSKPSGGSSSSHSSSSSSKELKVISLEGSDRYDTAIKLSKSKFDKSDTVILSNSKSLADGLTVSPLATYKKAPILLTDGVNLSKQTKEEIARLDAKNVIVIGGNEVIKDSVINQLKSEGISKIERLGGQDRYETSLQIAKYIDENCYKVKDIVVSGGEGQADALSISSVAGKQKMPIILVEKNKVTDKTYEWLESKNLQNAYVMGGLNVVGEKAFNDINKITSKDIKDNRIGGQDRYETNAKVIEKFYEKDLDKVYVTKGRELIDALTAGPVASLDEAPVVITDKELSSQQTKALENKEANTLVRVGGGIVQKVIDSLKSCLNK
ncbi:hypothetical protein CHF27_010280 [Romboutsia maritimum]|uniref:Peptidase M14 domain-containing protein n=1 Tax=Romboutsia maritimum TaxID=2020948 RepID=A0A371IRF6_9FIRM|nr:cell wall-binding repeat-containing protein [Romboutsia maritimum]RDY23059.1 hypothetical protein CHF27_010280 [Romboutsia maritimum]